MGLQPQPDGERLLSGRTRSGRMGVRPELCRIDLVGLGASWFYRICVRNRSVRPVDGSRYLGRVCGRLAGFRETAARGNRGPRSCHPDRLHCRSGQRANAHAHRCTGGADDRFLLRFSTSQPSSVRRPRPSKTSSTCRAWNPCWPVPLSFLFTACLAVSGPSALPTCCRVP